MELVMTTLRAPGLLRAHMVDGGWTVRRLANAVERELIRRGDPTCRTCSPSSIAVLHSGRRRVCRHPRARAIEAVLGLQPGELFAVLNRPDAWFQDQRVQSERTTKYARSS